MGTSTRTRADAVVGLRRAVAGDVGALHAIELLSFSDPWSRYALTAAIESPALVVNVACVSAQDQDQQVVGYSVLARAADECELLNLAVAGEMRGRGIGGALLEEAMAEGRRWGARAMFLEVRASNQAARRLYEKTGFEQVGRRPGYYRRPEEDALVLRKVLV